MAELPSADQFNAPTVTEAQFKEAQAKLIDYVAEIGNKTVAIQYGFQSLEDFEADKTKIPAGSSVVVAGELYIWDGGALTKSDDDPLLNANQHTNDSILELVDIYAQKEDITDEDLLFAITDINNVRTWIEADKTGGVTQQSAEKIATAVKEQNAFLENKDITDDDLLFAITDINNVPTSLSVKKNGTFSNIAIQDIQQRINVANRAFSDTTKFSVWGSSTIENSHTQWAQLANDLGFINVLLGGKGAETAETICARQGSIPAKLLIPSGILSGSTDNQAVTVTNFYIDAGIGASALKPFAGTLFGIHGTLSYKSANPTQLWFMRDEVGEDIVVDSAMEYEFIPDSVAFRNSVCVLNIGKNNLNYGVSPYGLPDYVFECTKKAHQWCKPFYKFVLVMGHFVDTGADEDQKTRVLTYNSLLKTEFGESYYDLQAYLMSEKVWIDTAITPTSNDLAQQSDNRKPDSLSLDSLHMNDAAETAVIKQVKQILVEFGWYNILSED
ncbi:hypothetical protein [Acinetobacter populi]|uniref:Uncharacterized protein n=1 Tax=Acinetobacter populi TaxID=1582270 RepID=A0A1Z9YXQ2_9GAMM|nr:hypothetical protein [Acinetobacter populi]OUY06997.1 hypothetical protein CAP51_09890 [Acinetobacter populi]